jgi:chromosome segregation ATPase
MANLQGQITFYELVLGSTDTDGDGIADEVDSRLTELYKEYDAAKKEFDDLDTHVSNLNFERFKRESAEQEEDEAAFKRDRARADEEKAEYETNLAAIEEELKTATGQAKTDL